ncbi:recombinase family protein [Peptoniphilus grossensis]|uniref:Recombinase family protein n=1 Tax=Peptoniphilus grossensis TaxID=1465756 RepID=A0ABU7X8C7_9FIRM
MVKEAFDLLIKGYSCIQVANIFNEKGYITRSERKEELKLSDYTGNLITGSEVKKRVWTNSAISQITRNELYTGDYVYNKFKETKIGGRKRILLPEEEWKILPNTHEAIISREVFDKVKKIKEKRSFGGYTGNKNRSIFSDKIFFKECGRHMSFRCDSRQKKNSDKIYKYKSYYCNLCKAEKKPNDIKEKDIIELIKPKLKGFKIQNTLNKEKVIEHKNVKEEILKEISILNSKLQIIYENYKKKNISKEAYLKEKSLIQDKKILLESRLKELKSEKIDLKKEFDGNSLDKNNLLKAYVDSSIDKIVVSRTGEIEIMEKY